MPWGAHEEELLLEAVEQHGLGNWEGAAAAMGGSRSASDVAAHFFAVYIEGNLGQACLPPHVTSRVHDHNTASQLPLSSPPEQLNLSSLEQGALGFAPLRGDFDVEPDPGAESLVASLCFDPATEDDLEMELKRALASVYVQRLRERHRRKAVALDYGLIDTFFGHSTGRSFGLSSQLSVESRKSNSTTNSGLTQTSFDGRKSGKAGANATGNSISGLTSAISTDSRKAAKLCGNTAANTSAASGILVSMNGSCETRRALPMEPRTRLPALFGIVTCKELDKLEEMLRRERALRTRVRELQRWRRHGVTTVTDGAGFEAAARLQRAPKPADALTTTEGSLATFASTFSLPSTNAFPAASWDFLSMGEKAVCDVAGLAPGQYITTKATLLLQGPGRPGGGSGTGNVGLDRQQWKRVQRFLVRNRWYGPRQAA
uniref:Transcriptional adaptor 2B n=1 Tax=Eptatretus burgeri TaxID=7764 RepID=A0A8C4QLN9_EPTBU